MDSPSRSSRTQLEIEIPNRVSYNSSFHNSFREVLVKGLESYLGEPSAQAIICNLKLLNAGEDPAEIHSRLFSVLGTRVTLLVELRIINLLSLKLGGIFEIDRRNTGFLERNWKVARLAFESASKRSSF